MKRIVGIDLGTSSSMIKIKEYPDGVSPEAASLDCKALVFTQQKMASTPTLIRERGENRWFGYGAEQTNIKDSVLYQNFKVDLRSKDPQVRSQAVALTEKFFEFLYSSYAEQRQFLFDLSKGSSEDEETMVSYPAQWDEGQREIVLDAARKAGFLNVKGMDEATASVHCILNAKKAELIEKGLLQAGKPLNAVIVDMGAGTADLAFVRITLDAKLKTEILGTWPPEESGYMFGGSQMDELLVERMEKWLEDSGLAPNQAMNIVKGQRSAIKQWKELTMSPLLASAQAVDDCAAISGMCACMGLDLKPFPKLDRESVARDFRNHIETFIWLINSAPKELRDEVGLVILTGGNSQWYWIDEVLKGANDSFTLVGLPQIVGHPELLLRMELPTETVSRGLVYSKLPLEIKQQNEQQEVVKSDREKALSQSEWIRKRIALTSEQCLCLTGNGKVLFTKPNMFLRTYIDDALYDFSPFADVQEICCAYEHAVLLKTKDGRLCGNNELALQKILKSLDHDVWSRCRHYDYFQFFHTGWLLGVRDDGSLTAIVYSPVKGMIHDRLDNIPPVKEAAIFGRGGDVIALTQSGNLVFGRLAGPFYETSDSWVTESFPGLPKPGPDGYRLESGVEHICVLKERRAFLVLKKDGTAACYGNMDSDVKAQIKTWKDLVSIGIMEEGCYGLRMDNRLISATTYGVKTLCEDCIGFTVNENNVLAATKSGELRYMGNLSLSKNSLTMSRWNLFA